MNPTLSRLFGAACMVFLLLFVVAAGADTGTGTETDILTPEERAFLDAHPVLRVGVGVAFPPFQYVEAETGKLAFKGMVSDYLKLLEKRLGVRLEPVLGIPFKTALQMGRDGDIDIFAGISETPERREFLHYTKPYLSYPLVIVTRDDTPFVGSVEDLRGKRVATVKVLSTYSKFVNDLSHISMDFHFEEDTPAVLTAVSLGRADACVVNLAVASYLINTLGLPNLHVAAPTPWGNEDLAMAVRKDWPILADILQKGLDDVSAAERDAITQRWISLRYETLADPTIFNRIYLPGGVAAGAILIVVVIWNRRLRREAAERKRAEAAMRESEERFSKAFEASPAAMSISEVDDGALIELNDRWLSLMGYTRDEAIGQTAAELGGWVDMSRRAVFVERLKADGAVRDFNTLLRTKGGAEREVLMFGALIEAGGAHRALVLCQDITKRRESERALEKSERRLNLAIRSTQDGLWDWIAETGEFFMSPRWAQMVGYEPEDFAVGSDPFPDLLHPDDMVRVLTCIEEFFDGTETYYEQEFRLRHKDGHYVTILSNAFAERDADGRLLRFTGRHTDVTKIRETERQLLQSQKLESVGRLAGGIAHDFNNLLQVILSTADLAKVQLARIVPADDKICQGLDNILTAAVRGADLTKKMLAFSCRQSLTPETVDLSVLIGETLALLSRVMPENIEIKTNLEAGLPTINVDPHALVNAILNVATNARYAMPAGGTLTIGVRKKTLRDEVATKEGNLAPGDYIDIALTDTGYGMSAETLERAFEPFYTTREVGQGSGLGLSMVYGFAEQSKGDVAIESAIGKGTELRLLLPVTPQAGTSPNSRRFEAPVASRASIVSPGTGIYEVDTGE
jgi:PAS domain S-box-containing protein